MKALPEMWHRITKENETYYTYKTLNSEASPVTSNTVIIFLKIIFYNKNNYYKGTFKFDFSSFSWDNIVVWCYLWH